MSHLKEIQSIWLRYRDSSNSNHLESLEDVNRFALRFGIDVAETFRRVTLLRHPHLYLKGFGLVDAPIVGLLVRISKLLRLSCRFYELNIGDYIAVYARPLVESAIMARYLLSAGDDAVVDFRRCSYKDTLRILREYENGSKFLRTKAGSRVLKAALDDLALECLTVDEFAEQKRNKWRVQGKSRLEIFSEVIGKYEYLFVYGMMSESLHGSWNESLDWSLSRNDDGTYSAFADFVSVDARSLLPLVRYSVPAYSLWVERLAIKDESLLQSFERINEYSTMLYRSFDNIYDDNLNENAESTILSRCKNRLVNNRSSDENE